MIKAIKRFFSYLFQTTSLGFYKICSIMAKGFFFYFYLIAAFFEKIFHGKLFKKLKTFFSDKQADPVAFLMIVLFFFVGVFLHTYLYVDSDGVQYVDASVLEKLPETVDGVEEAPVPDELPSDRETYSSNEVNLYRKYAQMDIDSVNFKDFEGSDVVGWIKVDGTHVNYPIVQSSDNDYYLNHDIETSPKASGWIFMDYRNDREFGDSNTIIYGHNLLNRTAFGSLANVFTNNWYEKSSHLIIVRTLTERHIFKVFSCYYSDPVVYYLQNNFYSNSDYQDFLNNISSKSIYNFGETVGTNDKIITLSTCADDNKGRKVIHAKMIE